MAVRRGNKYCRQKKEMKTKGTSIEDFKQLNADFQQQARKDKGN